MGCSVSFPEIGIKYKIKGNKQLKKKNFTC